jgi:hypothetical protein
MCDQGTITQQSKSGIVPDTNRVAAAETTICPERHYHSKFPGSGPGDEGRYASAKYNAGGKNKRVVFSTGSLPTYLKTFQFSRAC